MSRGLTLLVITLVAFSYLSSCKAKLPHTKENLILEVNYFKGEKLAISLPDQFTYSPSNNLIVYPGADSIEIRAIATGDGYVTFRTGQDTLLHVTVTVENDPETEAALRLAATNDPLQYRNNELASWLYGMALQNKPLPAFSVQSIDNKKITNATIDAKISVVHFWYYGCPACMMEMDDLEKLGDWISGRRQFQFIALCKDTGYFKQNKPVFLSEKYVSDKDGSRKVVAYENVSFNALHGINGASLEGTFAFAGYPITFITDKKGIVRYIFNGSSAQLFEKTKAYMTFLNHLEE